LAAVIGLLFLVTSLASRPALALAWHK